jgi:DNA-directed RNA polymerase subunit RPC12/RpoP
MPSVKYLCHQCQEMFELLGAYRAEDIKCPRCGGRDIKEMAASGSEAGPPPWEYVCQQCGGGFRIKAPSGPSEAKNIRCPRCGSREVKWLATTGEACPPGG